MNFVCEHILGYYLIF